MDGTQRHINICLALAVLSNIIFWAASHNFYARWAGVPPVPSRTGAVMMALGDEELAFRLGALTLQHLGNSGGRMASLIDYDYQAVGRWLDLLDSLDPASDHVPTIAAYYFGAIDASSEARKKKIGMIVDFLVKIGQRPVGDKWRFLADAAFLARHRMQDLNLALDIAYTLSKMQLTSGRDLPSWAREMPAFILKAQGEKDAAKQMVINTLNSEKYLPPQEINFLKSFLLEQLKVDPKEVEVIFKDKK